MSTINNTTTATARKDATRPADVEWDAMRKGARLGYPAVNGDMVTQGHADYCEEYGHAVHMEDGEESPWCPRCGDARVEESPATRTALHWSPARSRDNGDCTGTPYVGNGTEWQVTGTAGGWIAQHYNRMRGEVLATLGPYPTVTDARRAAETY